MVCNFQRGRRISFFSLPFLNDTVGNWICTWDIFCNPTWSFRCNVQAKFGSVDCDGWVSWFGMIQPTTQSFETRGPEVRSADIVRAPNWAKMQRENLLECILDKRENNHFRKVQSAFVAAGSERCFGQTPQHSSSKTQGHSFDLLDIKQFFANSTQSIGFDARSFGIVWKQTWNSAPFWTMFGLNSFISVKNWADCCKIMWFLSGLSLDCLSAADWTIYLHLELVSMPRIFSCPSS